MKKSQISSIFFRYIISFGLAFVFPLFILGMVMNFSYAKILHEQTYQYSFGFLKTITQNIDAEFEEMNRLAYMISSSRDFRNLNQEAITTESIKYVHTLGEYATSNKFFTEIFTYRRNNEMILSSSSTYSADKFIDIIFKYDNWSSKDFFQYMNTINTPKIRPSEKIQILNSASEKYLTYFIPIAYGNEAPTSVFYFLIPENRFFTAAQEVIQIQDAIFTVLDHDKKTIFSSDNNMNNEAYIRHLEDSVSSGSTSYLSFNGKKYTIASYHSTKTGMYYCLLIPYSEATKRLASSVYFSLFCFILLTAVGMVMVYYLANINYKPINQLYKTVTSFFGNEDKGNELKTVIYTVDKMSETIDNLQKRVQESEQEMRNSILLRLIKGKFIAMDDLISNCCAAGINIKAHSYLIVEFLLHSPLEPKAQIMMDSLSGAVDDYFHVYSITGILDDRIAWIITADKKDYNIITSFIRLVLENYHIDATVGIGKWKGSPTEIPSSFLEASSSLDFRFIQGKNSIIFFESIEQKTRLIEYYPAEMLEHIENAVLSAHSSEVLNILGDLFVQIKNLDLPLFQVKLLCNSILDQLKFSLYKMKKDIYLREYKYMDVTSLSGAQTVDELSIYIGKFCLFICAALKYMKEAAFKSKIDEMLEYVEKNFSDPNFSIQLMADTFYMSISGISHYFKDNTGENISETVNRFRMEAAKRLLRETDDSLQSITNQIGYINVSSFIRKFKSYTNTTPGNYRQFVQGDTYDKNE